MKKTFLALFLFVTAIMSAQGNNEQLKSQIVEASCGQCQFGMEGYGCELAVRIDGKSYFVDGTSLDSHGDAHASDGFCTAIRKASVIGEIKNNRFVVSQFKLLPEEKENKAKLVALIIENSSKRTEHTPNEQLLFESKTILLTSEQICKHSYFGNFKKVQILRQHGCISYRDDVQADELVKCIA